MGGKRWEGNENGGDICVDMLPFMPVCNIVDVLKRMSWIFSIGFVRLDVICVCRECSDSEEVSQIEF